MFEDCDYKMLDWDIPKNQNLNLNHVSSDWNCQNFALMNYLLKWKKDERLFNFTFWSRFKK